MKAKRYSMVGRRWKLQPKILALGLERIHKLEEDDDQPRSWTVRGTLRNDLKTGGGSRERRRGKGPPVQPAGAAHPQPAPP